MFLKLFLCAFSCSIFFCLQACQLPHITNCGGILPYYYDDQKDETYFLLGKEWRTYLIQSSDRVVSFGYFCWQDFGGDLDLLKNDKTTFTMFNACLREAYEELHVAFPHLMAITKAELLPAYVQSNTYTVFLVRLSTKMSFDLLNSYFLSPNQQTDNFIFQTFRGDQISKEATFNEKDEYQWFTLKDIEGMIQNTNTNLLESMKEIFNDKQQSSTKIKMILDDISKKIGKEPMLFSSFIPFFKDPMCHDQNNTFTKSSIKTLINSGILQKQPLFSVKKWFTVLYCLLYCKKHPDQYEILSSQVDLDKKKICFYPVQAAFDTTEEFIDLFTSVEQRVHSVCYNKHEIRTFLKNIHFQINTDAKTAYCALEVTEALPFVDYLDNSEHVQDHWNYLNSFLKINTYHLNVHSLDKPEMKSDDSLDKHEMKSDESKITIESTSSQSTLDRANLSKNSWFQSKKVICFLQNYYNLFFGGITLGFIFLAFYWYKPYLQCKIFSAHSKLYLKKGYI